MDVDDKKDLYNDNILLAPFTIADEKQLSLEILSRILTSKAWIMFLFSWDRCLYRFHTVFVVVRSNNIELVLNVFF